MDAKQISRREFLKETGAGAIGASVVLPPLLAAQPVDYAQAAAVDRQQLIAALGDTLIPTATGYPGYRRLEAHGITAEVMKGLQGIPAGDLNIFNAAAMEYFPKPFVELSESDRTAFLERVAASIADGTFVAPSAAENTLGTRMSKENLDKVQRVFRLARVRVMTVFYQNFPQNAIARDANKVPVLSPGDLHQITNPNTSELVTGWDVANFPGPLSWQEEEMRRAYWMKTHWHTEQD